MQRACASCACLTSLIPRLSVDTADLCLSLASHTTEGSPLRSQQAGDTLSEAIIAVAPLPCQAEKLRRLREQAKNAQDPKRRVALRLAHERRAPCRSSSSGASVRRVAIPHSYALHEVRCQAKERSRNVTLPHVAKGRRVARNVQMIAMMPAILGTRFCLCAQSLDDGSVGALPAEAELSVAGI